MQWRGLGQRQGLGAQEASGQVLDLVHPGSTAGRWWDICPPCPPGQEARSAPAPLCSPNSSPGSWPHFLAGQGLPGGPVPGSAPSSAPCPPWLARLSMAGTQEGHATMQQDQTKQDVAQGELCGQEGIRWATSSLSGPQHPCPSYKPPPLGQPPQEAPRVPPQAPQWPFFPPQLRSPATSESNDAVQPTLCSKLPLALSPLGEKYMCDLSVKS